MKLTDKKIILASGSPRRLELLREEGIEPEVIKPDCEEELLTELTPWQTVMALSLKKGENVAEKLAGEPGYEDGLLIASDTIVYLERVIGKPADIEDARAILRFLSGRPHTVYSGAYIKDLASGKQILLYDATKVFFRPLSASEIDEYVRDGKTLDKAGSYAIQGDFARHIDHIEGNLDNVIGFPLVKIKETLKYL